MDFTGIKARWLRRSAALACTALAFLAGCGGGDPVERFRPTRIVSFGDEQSLVVASGAAGSTTSRKYLVNAVSTSASAPAGTIECTGTVLWNESVASAFGLSFSACPRAGTTASGLIYATPKAKVADVKTQVDNFFAGGNAFSHADVATVMAGLYDVLEQYALYPATPEATLLKNIEQRGKDLAAQVNRIAVTGAPVIVMRIPSVGYTPYAVQQGADRAALLGRLTEAFNNAMQLNLINDGHLVGLGFGDTRIRNVMIVNTTAGITPTLTSVTEPVCKAAANATDKLDDSVLLNCTGDAASLVTRTDGKTVSGSTYLWAGNLLLGQPGQSELGSEAVSRALNNPF